MAGDTLLGRFRQEAMGGGTDGPTEKFEFSIGSNSTRLRRRRFERGVKANRGGLRYSVLFCPGDGCGFASFMSAEAEAVGVQRARK